METALREMNSSADIVYPTKIGFKKETAKEVPSPCFFFSLSDFSGSYSNKRKGHPNYGLGKEGTLILAVAMPSFSSKNDNADEC